MLRDVHDRMVGARRRSRVRALRVRASPRPRPAATTARRPPRASAGSRRAADRRRRTTSPNRSASVTWPVASDERGEALVGDRVAGDPERPQLHLVHRPLTVAGVGVGRVRSHLERATRQRYQPVFDLQRHRALMRAARSQAAHSCRRRWRRSAGTAAGSGGTRRPASAASSRARSQPRFVVLQDDLERAVSVVAQPGVRSPTE